MTACTPAAAPERTLSVSALPSSRPDRVVVEVVGEVDTFTAPLLDACLHAQATRPGVRRLVVDLRRASLLGRAGARAVARAERLCRRRGAHLSVRHGGRIVPRTVHPAGFDDRAPVESPVSPRVRAHGEGGRPRSVVVAVPERPAS